MFNIKCSQRIIVMYCKQWMYNCTYYILYIVQCPNITVTTDNGALTLLPALLHRGRNFLHFLFRKFTKIFFPKIAAAASKP